MRWGQVFGSGFSAWLVKAVLWIVLVFAAMWFVPAGMGPDAQPPGTPVHDVSGFDTGLAIVMAFIVTFADGVLMLVIGGILVAIVQHRRMTWRDGLAAGLMQALLLAWPAAGLDGFALWGRVAAVLVVLVELSGAAVGVVVWRRMQRPVMPAEGVF